MISVTIKTIKLVVILQLYINLKLDQAHVCNEENKLWGVNRCDDTMIQMVTIFRCLKNAHSKFFLIYRYKISLKIEIKVKQ